MCISCWF